MVKNLDKPGIYISLGLVAGTLFLALKNVPPLYLAPLGAFAVAVGIVAFRYKPVEVEQNDSDTLNSTPNNSGI